MTWWEFFEISEDASLNELKDAYLQALQEVDHGDLDQKLAIQCYYHEALDDFKDRANQSNFYKEEEKEHTYLRKVQFKKIEQPMVDVENDEDTATTKKSNKITRIIGIIFTIVFFVPFIICYLFVKLCRFLFKHYKRVMYLLSIVVFGVALSVFFKYRNHQEPVKQSEIVSKQPEIKLMSQNELLSIRMKEAQKFYEQNREKIKDKELAVVKISTCTVKFSQTHTYQHPLTGNTEFDAEQQKYDDCFDV